MTWASTSYLIGYMYDQEIILFTYEHTFGNIDSIEKSNFYQSALLVRK